MPRSRAATCLSALLSLQSCSESRGDGWQDAAPDRRRERHARSPRLESSSSLSGSRSFSLSGCEAMSAWCRFLGALRLAAALEALRSYSFEPDSRLEAAFTATQEAVILSGRSCLAFETCLVKRKAQPSAAPWSSQRTCRMWPLRSPTKVPRVYLEVTQCS